MAKFGRLREVLLETQVAEPDQFQEPQRPPREWLELVHTPHYVTAYCQGTLDPKAQRRIGLPWSPSLVQRTCCAVGGTLLTAQLALEFGLACNTAGGTHHAFPDYGSGFCIFNDCAIAVRLLQQQQQIKQVLIIDLDVHQGDGTAVIFEDDPTVFTFSMHCGANFPLRKARSDLDVPLPVGMEDREYLQTLDQYLPDLLSQVKPDLVFYNAGVDPHAGDSLGKLALTDQGIWCREMQVISACQRGGYPLACVIGGGYCPDLEALVYRHSLLHRAATLIYQQKY
jgi:acetoin utilization deacetylase AcuC-like enzyme